MLSLASCLGEGDFARRPRILHATWLQPGDEKKNELISRRLLQSAASFAPPAAPTMASPQSLLNSQGNFAFFISEIKSQLFFLVLHLFSTLCFAQMLV
jgi:hypothetical protein